MARAERRRPARTGARWNPWWLAVPVLGIAAYAAFAATLALLGDDPARTPSAVVPRPSLGAAPLAAPAAKGGDVAPAPAAVPPPMPEAVVDAGPTAAPPAVPDATATPAVKRAAADGARKVNPKRAPQEHLTDKDRRALDALVEQAGKDAR